MTFQNKDLFGDRLLTRNEYKGISYTDYVEAYNRIKIFEMDHIKPWKVPDNNKPVGVCSLCKRDVYAIELYSCSISGCPIQLKATL